MSALVFRRLDSAAMLCLEVVFPGNDCVHFVQMQDYPTYNVDIIAYDGARKWEIRPSLDWLKADLKDKAGKPVVINFHQIEIYELTLFNKL